MTDSAPDIVFWGTPDAAAQCLLHLLAQQRRIVGVVTQPDRPAGRKHVVSPSPVKRIAAQYAVPVLQPERIKTPEFAEQIKAWKPDICVIVAYGRIITQTLIDIPGTFLNLHFSLLPRYRGAAPVQWAVMNGDAVTGVTVQHLALELDSGDIVVQHPVPIAQDDTAETLLQKCVRVGAPLLDQAVQAVVDGTAPRIPQNHAEASWAPKISREHGFISWYDDAGRICNQVRACTPWPGTTTWHDGVPLKIIAARVAGLESPPLPPGSVIESRKNLTVVSGRGVVEILELQPPNRPRMSAEAFLAGHRHAVTRFQSWSGDHPE